MEKKIMCPHYLPRAMSAFGLALASLNALAAPAVAQLPSIHITPYAGGAWFSELGEVQATFLAAGGDPGDPPARVTNIELKAEARPMSGISISSTTSRAVAFRLNAAFVATEFDLSGVSSAPGSGALTNFNSVGGLADLYVTLLGVDLIWRLASSARPLSPYVVIGAGAGVWDLNALNDFETIEPLTGIGFTDTPRTSVELQGSFGLGVDLQFDRQTSLRLEAMDHIGTNPIHSGDFITGPDFTGTTDTASLVHAFRISAGVNFGIGR